jgi:hypothetical protein
MAAQQRHVGPLLRSVKPTSVTPRLIRIPLESAPIDFLCHRTVDSSVDKLYIDSRLSSEFNFLTRWDPRTASGPHHP